MILTVTLNPAFDKIYWVEELKTEGETALNRAYRSHSSAGGKGINVSIFLSRLGVENIAMGFIAGHTGRAIKRSVREEGITTNFIWTDGETRTNVALLRKGKEDQPISINEMGPPVPEKAIDQLLSQFKIMLKRVSYAVISGSLPPQAPQDIYARMVKMAKRSSVKTIVNTGGPQLSEVVEAGPFLLKPDIRESNVVLGEKITDMESILQVGQKIIEKGTSYALISHEITGDILISEDECWDLETVRDQFHVKNEVGAGDALIGGILYKLQTGSPIIQAVKYGMASAIASGESYGKLCRDTSLIQADMDKVLINSLKGARK